jgi:hypothetical protein
MKKIVKLTESQLEEIIRRVIAEQEDYTPTGGWNEKQLKYHETEAKKIFKSSVKPDMGGKYCFTKKQDPNSVIEELKRSIGASGSEGKSLYKIKNGDTPDRIKMMSPNYDVKVVNSKSCDMNKPRIGDVVLIKK